VKLLAIFLGTITLRDLSGVWQAERTPESEFTRVLGSNFPALQVDSNDITKNVVDVF
jgi:hypothetical protein